ncbi:septum site-determining protein Ssd [Saccharothrix coeruleofusca]|uniref:Rv3660c-like CheY-like N-terminal domain-containing protein n=1 Tax=Saccharothrix coeruleofusca TaxID=33919 RepID=A0A918EC07_9PSEU|nr:septum site-determining protein Ssd [Saccharothrix coeruleofusca]MBP2340328.1 secretion/DNA translocation related CpaE-like protein [Saccharothrix coeruleofusca]GGP36153.1 hypothetical protein GCM10010185_04000 [Saccharothrix coeruleofusca]
MRRPVALVTGEELLDEVLRLAAAAECEVERVADVAALRGRWAAAPAVLLDQRALEACAAAGLPRRPDVLLVATGPPSPGAWPRAVALGVARVVVLPQGAPELVAVLREVADGPPTGGGRVLAVLGGRGGAGASVLAAALGHAVLAAGGNGLLVDCDPLGGGLDLALGVEAAQGLRWPDVRVTGGRVPASSLRSALPGRSTRRGTLSVLACGRAGPDPEPEAVAAVVESGRRAGDTVVCDLPRQLTPAACAALDRADLAVLVVPAEVRACAAAQRVARQVGERGVALGAVVRGPAPGGLRAGQVADAVGVPLLTVMPSQPRLAGALDRGGFPGGARGRLAKAAREVLAVLREG